MAYGGDRKNTIIAVLVLLVIVLLLFVVYAFIIRPQINGYVVSKQIEAQGAVINAILAQIQANGYVQIPVGNESLVLIPYNPSTQNQAQTQTG